MSRNWKVATENAVLYGLVSALLFAGVFTLLRISGAFFSDVFWGAIAGASSGILISVVVGLFDQVLTHKQIAPSFITRTGSNSIFGTLAGALITTGVIVFVVQLTGFVNRPQIPVVFGVSLCCVIGTVLGVVIGLPIGASWQSK